MRNLSCFLLSTLCMLTFGISWAKAQALATPAMTGPLQANTTPLSFEGGALGKVYVGGVLSGLAKFQSNQVSTDRVSRFDIDNAQMFVQNTTGPFQFYVQTGGYSLPALGTPYLRSSKATDEFYGVVPVAYAKLVPNDQLSFMVGKLPTLIGSEYTFTFQNMNIERGLLWNQENAVNRGVQANFTKGAWNTSLALTDGFYSEKYNWLSFLSSYQLDPSNTLAFVVGRNLGKTSYNTLATPIAQDNSEIYNIIYTYVAGRLTLSPYLQYTHVGRESDIGLTDSATTQGAAFLAKYNFDNNFSLAERTEYITSSGNSSIIAPNLLYGNGSSAYSFTVTPGYQKDKFFLRGEMSFTGLSNSVAGSGFGGNNDRSNQYRALIEAGTLF